MKMMTKRKMKEKERQQHKHTEAIEQQADGGALVVAVLLSAGEQALRARAQTRARA